MNTGFRNNELIFLLSNGVSEAMLGKKDEARLFFTQALELDRRNSTALLWLAWLANDAHDALVYLEKLLAFEPDNQIAKSYQAQARERLAKNPSANPPVVDTLPKQPAQSPTRKPFIGETLLQLGFVSRHQLEIGLKFHRQMAVAGKPRLIGQVLVDLGYLSSTQVEAGIKYRDKVYYTALGT